MEPRWDAVGQWGRRPGGWRQRGAIRVGCPQRSPQCRTPTSLERAYRYRVCHRLEWRPARQWRERRDAALVGRTAWRVRDDAPGASRWGPVTPGEPRWPEAFQLRG